jgi:UrcA family protein
MRTFPKSSAALSLVLLAALQAGTAAHADAPASKMVSLAGLNLAKATDLDIARERLRAAAAEVCRTESAKQDALADETCRLDTFAAAMGKVLAWRSTLASVVEMREAGSPPSKLVSLADLDLAKNEHLDIARNRLKAAAREVCMTAGSQVDYLADARCVADTYAAAMKKVSDQLVTAGMVSGAEHLARIY